MVPVLAPASKKQEIFLNSDATITLAGGAAGSGKALRYGELVHTPSGFIRIQDCQVGTYVTTPSGKVEMVTGFYPQGIVPIYRVNFEDGTFIDTCAQHLWKVRCTVKDDSGEDVKQAYEVKDTSWIQSQLEQGARLSVPLTMPVEFKVTGRPPLDPYQLGSYLSENAPKMTRVVTRLRIMYGLTHLDKFIPEPYINASVAHKIKLAQGILDHDAWVDADGSIIWSTNHKRLAYQFKYLLASLGMICIVEPSHKRNYFTLTIYGRFTNKLLTKKELSSKADRITDEMQIKSIEYVGEHHAACISITGKEKLFLTTGYIVTHNTYTSLLIALKFMQHPRATGVIFRRTSKMITSPGSIWHEAVNMYSSVYKTGLRIRHRENEIIFPNGAVLKFSHMQHESNVYDHKGGQYSLVIFDEATDFTEEMIVYLLSRMRNANVNYKPQMFLMTNPDYNSFLRLWIQDFYLDPQTGIPKEELAGVKRYFFRQGNQMLWYNSLEEAESVHGAGDSSGITSFTFIPATCRDNPPLLKAQPSYISNLMSLPRVEMERLLLGSWFARQEASGHFKREWCAMVDRPNIRATKRIRAWDFAASKPSEQYPNPDWTRGTLISKDASSVYTVEDMVSLRDRVHKVEELVFRTAIQDGKETLISIPVDPNAQAAAYAKNLQRRLAEMGFNVRLTKPVKSKLVRFAPFSSIAQAGFVQVVVAEWNKDFFDELEIFNGDGKTKDDIVDTCSDCIYHLNREQSLPTMVMNDISVGSSTQTTLKSFSVPTGYSSSITIPTFNI